MLIPVRIVVFGFRPKMEMCIDKDIVWQRDSVYRSNFIHTLSHVYQSHSKIPTRAKLLHQNMAIVRRDP